MMDLMPDVLNWHVESSNRCGRSAQHPLLQSRLLTSTRAMRAACVVSPKPLCKSLKAAIFCGPLRFSQRFPQCFPHFLCKESLTLADEPWLITGKVHDGRRFSFERSCR